MEGNGFLLDFIQYFPLISGIWLLIFIYGFIEIEYLKITIRWLLLYALGISVGIVMIAETLYDINL